MDTSAAFGDEFGKGARVAFFVPQIARMRLMDLFFGGALVAKGEWCLSGSWICPRRGSETLGVVAS